MFQIMSVSPSWITEEGSSCFLSFILLCPHTVAWQILTNCISRSLLLKILWYLFISSRIRSKLLNMIDRDICSYSSNSIPGTALWLESPQTMLLSQTSYRLSSAALGGDVLQSFFSKLLVSEHGSSHSIAVNKCSFRMFHPFLLADFFSIFIS